MSFHLYRMNLDELASDALSGAVRRFGDDVQILPCGREAYLLVPDRKSASITRMMREAGASGKGVEMLGKFESILMPGKSLGAVSYEPPPDKRGPGGGRPRLRRDAPAPPDHKIGPG